LLVRIAANGVQDAPGRPWGLYNVFHPHQLSHTLKAFDMLLDPSGLPETTGKAITARLAEAARHGACNRSNIPGRRTW